MTTIAHLDTTRPIDPATEPDQHGECNAFWDKRRLASVAQIAADQKRFEPRAHAESLIDDLVREEIAREEPLKVEETPEQAFATRIEHRRDGMFHHRMRLRAALKFLQHLQDLDAQHDRDDIAHLHKDLAGMHLAAGLILAEIEKMAGRVWEPPLITEKNLKLVVSGGYSPALKDQTEQQQEALNTVAIDKQMGYFA